MGVPKASQLILSMRSHAKRMGSLNTLRKIANHEWSGVDPQQRITFTHARSQLSPFHR